jgi:DNA-binding SARP family transcriptional activator
MEFRLLGPLEVSCAGRTVRLGAARERSVLAILLLNANAVVPIDSLVDQLWPDDPPESAVHAVHVSVSRLRRALDDGGASRIETRRPGYLLRVQPGELDLDRFRLLCREGREHAARGDPESASAAFAEAAVLWRGPAVADLAAEPFAQAAAARLAEAQMEAVEARFTADLELGRHAALVAELEEYVAVHPLRERLQAQLMRALYGCGRQADALAVFREARALLVEELGVEPGPELREVEASILAGEPQPGRSRSGSASLAPLPAVTPSFTGRIEELDRILALVPAAAREGAEAASGLIAICAVDGMAGIGKTTLALRAAHVLADRFPDGCLFIDLHGYTDQIAPVEPAQALDRLLRSLGVPGDRIPADPEDRAALYRSQLAGKRLLVVLDNAGEAAQVRPLLPASTGCLVLVTTRRRLSGLDDAAVLSLDVLPTSDASALFGKVVGADRVTGHDGAVHQIVELCGRLPLAVRIAAARLRHRPVWTPEQLAARLAREHGRLVELADSDRSVAAAFAVSYRDLGEHQQRLFRLLGLHPGSDFDVYAAAALGDTSVAVAERLLEGLLDAHLLGQQVPGRYRFHDLMREYAARLAAERDTDVDRTAALTRLLDYYLQAAATAVGVILPFQRRRIRALSLQTTVIPSIVSTADARIWLNAERATLVSAIVFMDGRRWATQLSSLIQILTPWLIFVGTYGAEALTVNGRLLEIARDRDDRVDEAAALHGLAWANQALHQFPESFDYGQRALRLFREIGDAAGESAALNTMGCSTANVDTHTAEAYLRQALVAARAAGDDELEARSLHNLVFTCDSQGRYREAIGYLTECLAISERTGNMIGISSVLYSLGCFHLQLGHDELALDHLQRALAVSREAGSRTIESASLDVAGQVLRRQGRYAEALEHHQQALALTRDRHDEIDEAHVLVSLGETRQAQGDIDGAVKDLRHAVALVDGRKDPTLGARALNALGSALLANDQAVDARTSHESALRLSAPDVNRNEEARALDGIAATCHNRGDHADARRFWLRALAIYTALEVPEADVVRARLATLDGR